MQKVNSACKLINWHKTLPHHGVIEWCGSLANIRELKQRLRVRLPDSMACAEIIDVHGFCSNVPLAVKQTTRNIVSINYILCSPKPSTRLTPFWENNARINFKCVMDK